MTNIYNAIGPDGLGPYEIDLTGPQASFERSHRGTNKYLVPGFVDIHLHGAFGIDFMEADPAEIEILARGLAHCGYEGFLLTTVTAEPAQVQKALDQVPITPEIWGVHIEGPFISPKHAGAQPPDLIRQPVTLEPGWDEIFENPHVKIVTLAPEIPGALELITKLREMGKIASMGHSDATFEEARRGFEFGATHATHTFNAMRGFHHREAGLVGYVLTNPDIVAELIYDRLHVSSDAARLLLRSRNIDAVVAVSDSTMATGLAPGTEITMWGLEAEVGRGDVRLKDGTLAGSSITLLDAFKRLAEDFGVETAVHLCCLNPRDVLKVTTPPKVWVELDDKFELIAVHKLDTA